MRYISKQNIHIHESIDDLCSNSIIQTTAHTILLESSSKMTRMNPYCALGFLMWMRYNKSYFAPSLDT